MRTDGNSTGAYKGGGETHPDGSYTIYGLQTGSYRVNFYPWVTDYILEYYHGTYDYNAALPVTVSAGETTGEINFAVERGGTISGHVYQADGTTPIPNLHVYALNYDTGEWTAGENTLQDGSYRLVVPTGSYRVKACATCSNLPYYDKYYDSVHNSDYATEVPVTALGDTPDIDLSLNAVAKGDVNRDRNVDLADAILALQVLFGPTPNSIELAADVDGNGTIGLTDCIYVLQIVSGERDAPDVLDPAVIWNGTIFDATISGSGTIVDWELRQDGTTQGKWIYFISSFSAISLNIDGLYDCTNNRLSFTITGVADLYSVGDPSIILETSNYSLTVDGALTTETEAAGTYSIAFDASAWPDHTGKWSVTKNRPWSLKKGY